MSTLNEIYIELLDAQKDAAIEKDMSLKSVEHCILFINVLRKIYIDNTLDWALVLDLHPDTMMCLYFRKGKESLALILEESTKVVYAFVNHQTDECHRGHFFFPLKTSQVVPKNILVLIDRFVQPGHSALTCPVQCGPTYQAETPV